jgi:hypothetical protein
MHLAGQRGVAILLRWKLTASTFLLKIFMVVMRDLLSGIMPEAGHIAL